MLAAVQLAARNRRWIPVDRCGLECQTLGVAVTDRVYVRAHALEHRVIGRHRTVLVDAQNLPAVIGVVSGRDLGGRGRGLRADATAFVLELVAAQVADRVVELGIGPEHQTPGTVIVVGRKSLQHHLRVAQAGRRATRIPVTHDARPAVDDGAGIVIVDVGQKDEILPDTLPELGVQRQPHQSVLADLGHRSRRVALEGQSDIGNGQQHTACTGRRVDTGDATDSLGDVQEVVGAVNELERIIQAIARGLGQRIELVDDPLGREHFGGPQVRNENARTDQERDKQAFEHDHG